jgi:hypothetical protein
MSAGAGVRSLARRPAERNATGGAADGSRRRPRLGHRVHIYLVSGLAFLAVLVLAGPLLAVPLLAG